VALGCSRRALDRGLHAGMGGGASRAVTWLLAIVMLVTAAALTLTCVGLAWAVRAEAERRYVRELRRRALDEDERQERAKASRSTKPGIGFQPSRVEPEQRTGD
jgi:hypothetical protein